MYDQERKLEQVQMEVEAQAVSCELRATEGSEQHPTVEAYHVLIAATGIQGCATDKSSIRHLQFVQHEHTA